MYGGLRGAIGICFALIIAGDDTYSATLRQMILFDMAGCAILTLIINGTTTTWMIKRRGLNKTSEVKERVFINYLENFQDETQKYEAELKNQPYLNAVDWTKVDELIGKNKYDVMVNEGYKRLAKMTEEKKQMVMNQLGVKKKSTKKSTVTGDLDQE